MTLEVAEIVCKCLDWKSPNLKKLQRRAGDRLDLVNLPSDFGITVSKSFLLLIEEVSYQIELLGNEVSKKTRTRVQAQMYEIFKRVITEKEDKHQQDMRAADRNDGDMHDQRSRREEDDFIKNYESA